MAGKKLGIQNLFSVVFEFNYWNNYLWKNLARKKDSLFFTSKYLTYYSNYAKFKFEFEVKVKIYQMLVDMLPSTAHVQSVVLMSRMEK